MRVALAVSRFCFAMQNQTAALPRRFAHDRSHAPPPAAACNIDADEHILTLIQTCQTINAQQVWSLFVYLESTVAVFEKSHDLAGSGKTGIDVGLGCFSAQFLGRGKYPFSEFFGQ